MLLLPPAEAFLHGEEWLDEVEGQREDHRGIVLHRDLGECLQVAQWKRNRFMCYDLRGGKALMLGELYR